MKTILLTAAIGVAFALGTTLEANATITTYTDEPVFKTKIMSGYYLEDFHDVTLGEDLGLNMNYAGFGYTYSIKSTLTAELPAISGLYGVEEAISVSYAYDSLVVDFTSGNVTAVGGIAYLTGKDGKPFTGMVKVTLRDGTHVTTDFKNFFGFTGAVIDSLTITSDLTQGPTIFNFVSLDNFYVGTAVPEPSTFTAGLLLALLIGFHWALRERKQAKNS